MAAAPSKAPVGRIATMATKNLVIKGQIPVNATARMAVLQFRLYLIPHRNSLGFGRRSKIGAFRGRHPIRLCFVFLARFRAQLEFDKLTCTSLVLD
jgi:hypothetical protein